MPEGITTHLDDLEASIGEIAELRGLDISKGRMSERKTEQTGPYSSDEPKVQRNKQLLLLVPADSAKKLKPMAKTGGLHQPDRHESILNIH
jgi:hypothetical protein